MLGSVRWVEQIVEQELCKPVDMHRTSHWLGLDVHVGLCKQAGGARVLEPGVVLTIELPLYVADHLEDVDPAWHGIGVRIEDDVLVTAGRHEVLSAAVAKAIDAIEVIRAESLGR